MTVPTDTRTTFELRTQPDAVAMTARLGRAVVAPASPTDAPLVVQDRRTGSAFVAPPFAGSWHDAVHQGPLVAGATLTWSERLRRSPLGDLEAGYRVVDGRLVAVVVGREVEFDEPPDVHVVTDYLDRVRFLAGRCDVLESLGTTGTVSGSESALMLIAGLFEHGAWRSPLRMPALAAATLVNHLESQP